MQYIYTMKGLGKVHPPDTVVLKDIWLSFLPGAKIGVLGLNGAGKSTLLEDHGGRGHRVHRRGVSRRRHHRRLPSPGAAARSRRRTCKGNVEEGVAETKALLDRYDELNMKLGEDLTPERWTSCSRSRAGCRTTSTRSTRGSSTRSSRSRWTRCAVRLPTPTSRTLSGGERRRVACAVCCSSRPTCCCSTSRPTISTPSRSRGSSGSSRNTRAPSSP